MTKDKNETKIVVGDNFTGAIGNIGSGSTFNGNINIGSTPPKQPDGLIIDHVPLAGDTPSPLPLPAATSKKSFTKEEGCFDLQVQTYDTFVRLYVKSPEDMLSIFNTLPHKDHFAARTTFGNVAGVCFSTRGLYTLIYVDASLSSVDRIATLSHELAHASFYILSHVGVKVSVENHEAVAYLISHLMREAGDLGAF